MEYEDFLASKRQVVQASGFEVGPDEINPMLFDWQNLIVRWALWLGKAALFEACGSGKTPQFLEWARLICKYTGGRVLILSPLAVAYQTVTEGQKFGVAVRYCRSQAEADEADESIIITNYDMIKEFRASHFVGVVLDESGILKSFTGATKRLILNTFEHTPYKLACTATPAPNDHLELGNHAQFLNVMDSNEMIMRWFINDSMQAGNYRLKKHAEKDFWRWVTSWAVCVSTPSDLGYPDDGFILPELRIHSELVNVDHSRAHATGQLFLSGNLSATEMWRDKKETARDRCERARAIVGDSTDAWILWCDTNQEADILKRLFPEAIEVRGSDTREKKESSIKAFLEGGRILVSKAEMFGFGLNLQCCHNQIFVGITYSFETTYQALRRSWRFGQTQPVDAYMIYAESEGNIIATLQRKQEGHQEMQLAMNEAMRENGLVRAQDRAGLTTVEGDVAQGEDYTLYLGDCVAETKKLADASIDFTIFSPPFSTLYIYSDSISDMGNNEDDEAFFKHFGFLLPELLRVTVPGRLCAVHCKDLPLYMNRDDAAGLRDFPGRIIRAFEEAHLDGNGQPVGDSRWVYHSRVTIWKDPVIEMQRTKNHGLLYKNLRLRGEVTRQGMADYMVVFRKWTKDEVSAKPVLHEREGFPLEMWQRYASPVWFDVNQTRVLNYLIAKDEKDEKHICPLQLDVIERCIQLWTNPGDVVFSPFAGIGSEGYEALRHKRQFVGIELKPGYWRLAVKYLELALTERTQGSLFDYADEAAL